MVPDITTEASGPIPAAASTIQAISSGSAIVRSLNKGSLNDAYFATGAPPRAPVAGAGGPEP